MKVASAQLRRWMTLPPWTLVQKAVLKVGRHRRQRLERRTDQARPSFSSVPSLTLPPRLTPIPIEVLIPYEQSVRALSNFAVRHYFDVLGSGWENVHYGMPCRGFEGHVYASQGARPDADGQWLENELNAANVKPAQALWRLLMETHSGYVPIDWHRDIKSGFRWSPAQWHRDIPIGHLPGVDVKVPWELARMQHLVQLAWAFALASAGRPGFLAAPLYAREFQSQVLDFLATNPPRFGVNWRMPMEPAIRLANWVVAYDLFKAYGASFSSAFEGALSRGVYDHARFVRSHLEWDPDYRGNHYLANLAGLVFAGAWLPSSAETRAWFAFAVGELEKETRAQFYAEGSNFEGSVCYHRFSAEICVFATALAVREGYRFNDDHWRRLAGMARFTQDLTKPDGKVAQIGDNDSGRFLKLFPATQPMECAQIKAMYANLDGYQGIPDSALYWFEDSLDHSHLVKAIHGFFESPSPASASADDLFVRMIAEHPRAEPEPSPVLPTKGNWEDVRSLCTAAPFVASEPQVFEVSGEDLLAHFRVNAYPAFGVYVFRSKRLFAAVRCGSIGQRSHGGHAHNDQLSLELQIDGQDLLRDPGTFVYTALPSERNRYRSVRAHAAPQGAGEPGRLDLGLFALGNDARAECLYWGEKGFIGWHQGFGQRVFRVIEFEKNRVRVTDYYEENGPETRIPTGMSILYSPAYGVRSKNV